MAKVSYWSLKSSSVFCPFGQVADRAIYFGCIDFFLFLIFFFNDRSQNNYLWICWTDFRNLSPNESVLGADDQSGPLFLISQGMLATNFAKKWQTPHLCCSGIQKWNGILPPQCVH